MNLIEIRFEIIEGKCAYMYVRVCMYLMSFAKREVGALKMTYIGINQGRYKRAAAHGRMRAALYNLVSTFCKAMLIMLFLPLLPGTKMTFRTN